ncbi:MAG: hypothetical protein GY913_22865 [Proteobacteria bacterium]|nr:hypothetical protein [Pseudomonadota bacterium]MCP4919753.1 hypothetical protein [Pseudomonadota bacterium]
MLLTLLACIEPAEQVVDTAPESAVTDTAPDSTYETAWPDDSDSDSDTDTDDPGPPDEDGDGYDATEDCDDDDDDIHPGATEVFDGIDNDCDDRIDANGDYKGSLTVTAEGWYEGTKYTLTPDCPMTMVRGLTNAAWVVTCTTEASDTYGRLLLGETLTITPDDDYLWELDTWSGTAVFESSDGWDTNGTGTLSWNDMEKATLVIALDTQWLDVTGSGKLRETE